MPAYTTYYSTDQWRIINKLAEAVHEIDANNDEIRKLKRNGRDNT